jgi:putative ABC transport system permease protein
VAFTGLLSALLALQLEKSREYAVLRATGMSRRQLGGLILQQTTLLGIISAILALPLGYLLADRLIHVINLRSFGWSMEQIFPLEILPQSFLLAVSAAILAAVYPVWKLQCQAIAASLREE